MSPSKYKLIIPLGLAVCLSCFGDLTLFASLVTRLDVVGITLAQVGIILSIHRLIRIPGNPLAVQRKVIAAVKRALKAAK